MVNSAAAPFTQYAALLSLSLLHVVPTTYTSPPETAIAEAAQFAMPLGGDNVVAVPFTQYTALSLVLFDTVPATYTLPPETAIAAAVEFAIPLGSDNVVTAPFTQYTALSLVLFDTVPATYTSPSETTIALATEPVMPLGTDRGVTVAVGLPDLSCHSSGAVVWSVAPGEEVIASPTM
jgi:hypothetical protein